MGYGFTADSGAISPWEDEPKDERKLYSRKSRRKRDREAIEEGVEEYFNPEEEYEYDPVKSCPEGCGALLIIEERLYCDACREFKEDYHVLVLDHGD